MSVPPGGPAGRISPPRSAPRPRAVPDVGGRGAAGATGSAGPTGATGPAGTAGPGGAATAPSQPGRPTPSLATVIPTMGLPIGPFAAADALTIGVALEIPEPWAEFLQSSRERFGDPQARAIPAHVTLLPPTAVPRPMFDEVVDHLVDVSRDLRNFDLLLEGTDTFRPVSPVVFVKVALGGDNCDLLQRSVRTGPLARELSFPFHPHVTVAHHLDDAALDVAMSSLASFSARFTVNAFVLYEHGSDSVWRPRRRFLFGGNPPPDLPASGSGRTARG